MLRRWQPGDLYWTSDEPDAGELQRLIADALIRSAESAAHLSSVALINEVLMNEQENQTPEGEMALHLRAVAEAKRVETLIETLRDLDSFFLNLCSTLNALADTTEDPNTGANLATVREAVIRTDEVIRRKIEHEEQSWGQGGAT